MSGKCLELGEMPKLPCNTYFIEKSNVYYCKDSGAVFNTKGLFLGFGRLSKKGNVIMGKL